MDKNNIISSISYLDFVNKINCLINELLYSKTGYVFLKSKEAIFKAKHVLEKFTVESNKLRKDVSLEAADKIIKLKKIDLFNLVKKHYDSQIPIWAQEVFDDLIDNLLLDLSLNKDKAQNIYHEIINLINWLSSIKKFDKITYQAILNENIQKFQKALNSKDEDYLNQISEQKTDINQFVKIWNMILDDREKFLKIELSNLSINDVKYFNNIKNKLSNYKKTSIIDEIQLIKTAITSLNLRENRSIYDFISSVDNDFMCHLEQNKIIKEEDKIRLIKRRMRLFEDKNNIKNYFKDFLK